MAEQPERLSDAQVQEKWQEIAPLIDRMIERVNTRGEFPVEPGSSLKGDDKASTPYQVSHVLRMCLTAAVDHLHAVKALVVDRRVVHLAAPASLARGALENLATAYWILGPAARNERVARALRWQAQNFKDQEKAVGPLGLPGHSSLDDKLTKIDAVAGIRGIETKAVRRGYTSTEAVTFADTHVQNELGVILPWRLCSGFAHGRPWAYLGMSDREEFATDDDDIVFLRLTSNETKALYPTLAAMRLLEEFLRLYQQRARAVLA